MSDQQIRTFEVAVVDSVGRPVPKAKVTPWALRCSQGHGLWFKSDKRAGIGPQPAITDEHGHATVLYPYFRNVEEQIRTLSVSVCVDHQGFACRTNIHIDVPLATDEPSRIELSPGIPFEVRPLLDDQPVDLTDLYAIWSDGRYWQLGEVAEKSMDGTLHNPAMPAGRNSVLVIKLDGDRATHFSTIMDVYLTVGEKKRIDANIRPSLRVTGALSQNVARPVCNGRINAWTLAPAHNDNDRVSWFTWAPIQSDGTFTIDGWPAGERLQLIALCDGYIASSGALPDVVENPPDPGQDAFLRPQVFDPLQDMPLEVAMVSLSRCMVTAVDENDAPVSGVTVQSWPNVAWWNDGSQIYCDRLVRCERLLQTRDYIKALDDEFRSPFKAQTDLHGHAMLEMPPGNWELAISSEAYDLRAFLGRRTVQVEVVHGQTTDVVLRLQQRGTDRLGDWDKLAGVVFGCSTREGQKICALPGVQKQMDEFARRFREAKDKDDPHLLSGAYSAIADAFTNMGDLEEAAKWQQKATDEAAKAERVT